MCAYKIHYIYGDGKGKTSAAVGAAVRMAGSGGKVLFCSFLKDGSSSEVKILAGIENISYVAEEENFGFSWQMDRHMRQKAQNRYTRLFSSTFENRGRVDMIVLDELGDTIDCGFVEKGMVMTALQEMARSAEVVITGHRCDDELVRIADYVSEIKKVKHPFDKKLPARKGVEY